jgi:membrane-bound lytic murein transglycosylase A
VPARWSDLPGWDADALTELWPAFGRGCERAPAAWSALCADARALVLDGSTDATLRRWSEERLQPWRVETLAAETEGLATGYFEPSIEASRIAQGAYRVPLYAPPADIEKSRPWWSRRQIETLPHVQKALRGREIAWVRDRLDALLLQVQGSGRLEIVERDGSRHLVRLAFAAHNDQPYRSVGRWLIDQGELKADQASWPAIRSWAALHPQRVDDLLWSNPRYVFFREEPLPDPEVGPRGAQGVPLTPGRSVAVDPQSVPYGAMVWLDTTEPLSATPLRRAAMAQDTGSAITGAVRVDVFFGWGTRAEAQAGRMKQPLRLWALWPRNLPPPP